MAVTSDDLEQMERKQDYRRRQEAKGLVQVCVWLPRQQAGALQILAKRICEDRDLELGPLRSKETGRVVK